MRAFSLCRTAAASALQLSGSVLKTSARLTAKVAEAIAGDGAPTDGPVPSEPAAGTPHEPVAPDSAADTTPDSSARSVATAPTAVAEEGRDMADLAMRPAHEVVHALSALSAAELAELDEVERQHRRRSEVLAAIEDAARPATSEAERALAALREGEADVREPDRLVYSTETPS